MKEKHIYGFQQYETFSDFLVNVFILKKLELDNKSRPKIG